MQPLHAEDPQRKGWTLIPRCLIRACYCTRDLNQHKNPIRTLILQLGGVKLRCPDCQFPESWAFYTDLYNSEFPLGTQELEKALMNDDVLWASNEVTWVLWLKLKGKESLRGPVPPKSKLRLCPFELLIISLKDSLSASVGELCMAVTTLIGVSQGHFFPFVVWRSLEAFDLITLMIQDGMMWRGC